MCVCVCVRAQRTVRWCSGGFGIGKKRARHPHAHTHIDIKNTLMHCNCPCYSGALRCIVRLWSRINGGRGIRVNLLGTHGPGFVSKPHFGFVEGNGNDMGAKQGGKKVCLDLGSDVIHFFTVDIVKAL